MIKPIHLLLSVIVGFIAAYLFLSNEPTDIHLAEIKKLDERIKWGAFKEERYKDTIKLVSKQIAVIHTKRISAENEAAFLKAENKRLKAIVPQTTRDTIAHLVQVGSNCDSIIVAQDSIIADFKNELTETTKKFSLLDSLTADLKDENKNLIKKDSLHKIVEINLIKDMKKKKAKTGIIAFLVGLIGGMILK